MREIENISSELQKVKTFFFLNLRPILAASVMEQVAAVLDALSDAKETTRQQVIGLVERIALRLEKVESKNQQLVRENELLKNQLLNRVGYRVGNHSVSCLKDRLGRRVNAALSLLTTLRRDTKYPGNKILFGAEFVIFFISFLPAIFSVINEIFR